MSRPLNLYRLQQIDNKIDQADIRLKEIELLLSDDARLKKAKLQAGDTEKALNNAQKLLSQAELRVKDQRIKIEQVESTLYGGTVRNPKELQDLQNEVAALKRFLDILEERQLEAMLEVDEANEKNAVAQKNLQKTRVQSEAQHAELIKESKNLQDERKESLAQRVGAETVILPDDLVVYNRIRKQRGGIAIAKVEQRACKACGATLTASLHQAARSPSQIVNCETCGRILYAT